jgi:hypothetical protein
MNLLSNRPYSSQADFTSIGAAQVSPKLKTPPLILRNGVNPPSSPSASLLKIKSKKKVQLSVGIRIPAGMFKSQGKHDALAYWSLLFQESEKKAK